MFSFHLIQPTSQNVIIKKSLQFICFMKLFSDNCSSLLEHEYFFIITTSSCLSQFFHFVICLRFLFCFNLKGEYEDCTWGYGQNYPISWVQLHLVPLIPHSAIAKTVLVRSRFVFFLTRVKNQPLKQRLKQKRRFILINVRHIFSFA